MQKNYHKLVIELNTYICPTMPPQPNDLQNEFSSKIYKRSYYINATYE